MKLKTFLSLGSVAVLATGTTAVLVSSSYFSTVKKKGTIVSKDYENTMNTVGVPKSYKDTERIAFIAPFSDLGSWHSLSLPDYHSREFWGSFTQPMIVAQSGSIKSLGKSLDKLRVYEYVLDKNGDQVKNDDETYKMNEVNFKALSTEKVHIKQYPGGLWQEFVMDDLTIQVNLKFVHQKASMVKYKIINKTDRKRAFKASWYGEMWQGFKDDFGAAYEQTAYVDSHPYVKNEFGQVLARNVATGAGKAVYFQLNAAGDTWNEYTDATEIANANHVHTFRPTTGTNKSKVYLLTPVSSVKRQKTAKFSAGLIAYKFINKYAGDDDLNLNNTDNIVKNAVSIAMSGSREWGTYWGNWLGHQNDWRWQMVFPDELKMKIAFNDLAYSATTDDESPIIVNANQSNDLHVTSGFSFTAQERTGFKYQKNLDVEGKQNPGLYSDLIKKDMASKTEAQKSFDKSGSRWDYYLSNLTGTDNSAGSLRHRRVAVKAMSTLVNNWRGNAGMLEHEGITPSMSIFYFNSFWSWDSWKQATAAVHFDPQLAMDNIKVLFDNQVVDDSSKDLLYHFDANRRKSDLGMIPDLVDYNQDNTNWRDTKPPLSGWAVYNIYKTIKSKLWNKTNFRTGTALKNDVKEFLKYMYVRIMAYHAWWYLNRDVDGNGVNEYGATIDDGHLAGWQSNPDEYNVAESTAWESGMDNAIRFDKNGSGPNDPGLKWTLNRNPDNSVASFVLQQESVDLNSYMYAEKEYIVKIAEALKEMGVDYNSMNGINPTSQLYQKLMKPMKEQLATRLKGKAKTNEIMKDVGFSFDRDIAQMKKDSVNLKSYINTKMFDKKTGFFYDLRFDVDNKGMRIVNKDHLLVNRGKGPEGFIPLFGKAATEENARSVRKVIMDPKGFNTFVPFPTAAYDNPQFEPTQYWRGPVWLDQAYFGVRALDNYGYSANASYMVNKLFDNAQGLLDGDPIRENYNPLTGEGLNAKGFSWSSGMYLLMYQYYIKGNI